MGLTGGDGIRSVHFQLKAEAVCCVTFLLSSFLHSCPNEPDVTSKTAVMNRRRTLVLVDAKVLPQVMGVFKVL